MPRGETADRSCGALAIALAIAGCGRIGYEPDAGARDGGALDASRADAGDASIDAPVDAAPADAPTIDAGPLDAGSPGSARPLAPWSTGVVSRARPTFRFALDLADAGRVEICRDAACTMPVATAEGAGSAVPSADLPRAGSGAFFWRVTPLRAGAVAGPPSIAWLFYARYDASATAADGALLSQMDMNGDGLAELAVGAPGAASVRIHSGIVAAPTWTLPGASDFGASVASAGDVDGDGLAELLAGAPGAAQCEVVRITPFGPVRRTLSGPPGSGFGHALTTLGDVNGDGYSDVAIGAPLASAVHVFHGSAAGLPDLATRVLTGPGNFGAAIAGGDFDGDGFGDLAIATPDRDRVDVFHGSAAGIVLPRRIALEGALGSRFAASIGGHGDVTLDGRSDLVVGIPGGGTVRVYAGSPTGLEATARWTLDRPVVGFGEEVAIVQDVDANGYDDVLAGDGDGDVWIYYARGAGIGTSPGWSPQIGAPIGALGFGAAIGSTGDADGDRNAELLIGAPASAAAYLYPGASAGLGAELRIDGPPLSRLGASAARP